MSKEYKEDIKKNKPITIGGINSSYWGTPVMKVKYKNDASVKEIECYFEDDKELAEKAHKKVMKHLNKEM